MDVLKALELQQLGYAHTAKITDPPEIIALEIGDHHQLGDFLGRGEEIVGVALVELLVLAARARAFDRARDDRRPLIRRKHSGEAETTWQPSRSRKAE